MEGDKTYVYKAKDMSNAPASSPSVMHLHRLCVLLLDDDL